MDSAIRVTDLVLTQAPAEHQRAGLVAWIRCVINGVFRVDGLALRTTRSGKTRLSFPARRDARGGRHAVIEPVNGNVRAQLEAAILRALGAPDVASLSPPPLLDDEGDA